METFKSNNCSINFKCTDMKSCVYRLGKKCRYLSGDDCLSLVAQVNAVTINLKELMK